jgi:hypothetical protein
MGFWLQLNNFFDPSILIYYYANLYQNKYYNIDILQYAKDDFDKI